MKKSKEITIDTTQQLSFEEANKLIGYLYLLIDDIQFQYCPLISHDDNADMSPEIGRSNNSRK
jgi:hypothetical protein